MKKEAIVFVSMLALLGGSLGLAVAQTTAPSAITGVSVSCSPGTVSPSGASQCTATVSGTGSYSSAVTWSMVSMGGSISASGLYTATYIPQTYTATVKAVSVQDPTQYGTATVTETPTGAPLPSPATTPSPSSLPVATVTMSCVSMVLVNTTDTCLAQVVVGPIAPNVYEWPSSVQGLTWSVSGGGTINSSGVYTAPGYPTTATITATSVQDPTKSSSLAVSVVTAFPATMRGGPPEISTGAIPISSSSGSAGGTSAGSSGTTSSSGATTQPSGVMTLQQVMSTLSQKLTQLSQTNATLYAQVMALLNQLLSLLGGAPVACPTYMLYCPYGSYTVLGSNGCSQTVCNPAPTTPSSGTSFSYTWNTDLQYGMYNNPDVSALQEALTLQGLYSGPINGTFLSMTQDAVVLFQQKYGIPGTGYVGALTRAELNALYGTAATTPPTSTTSPLTVSCQKASDFWATKAGNNKVANVVLQATATGGNPPYAYLWYRAANVGQTFNGCIYPSSATTTYPSYASPTASSSVTFSWETWMSQTQCMYIEAEDASLNVATSSCMVTAPAGM